MGKTYEEIKTGANTFGSSVKILETIGKLGLEQAQGDTGMGLLTQTMIPAITLNAFTCELALKAMVVKNGATYGAIHELNGLYKMISEEDKRKISEHVISEMKKVSPNYEEIDFTADLDRHAKLFVDWRYFFEHGVSANLSFMDALFDAVLNVM